MTVLLSNIFGAKPAMRVVRSDESFEQAGKALKSEIARVFGRSLAIREVDSGSDNAAEIELNNLTTPYYDIERFGITFVASPRHADIIVVTGAVTVAMAEAVRKTYDAMPQPGWVIAVGDDACGIGILNDSYAVLGGADKILTVDFKIPGNPPTPCDIMVGLLGFIKGLGV
ncbi:MAG: formate hydrogenlyase [Dehalogenimonas sp.]|jgi:Ni,Fe-hydrogenase III small subunit|uniref:Formate hydrogenlyase n=1 Tax=Candidatus Dehalogenimonas loeffleri TaxID=3127115 RepID=A0ABZ2J5W0_9CHLR|nr:formate hydrogenlyase [Dehalogenimonas sp.]